MPRYKLPPVKEMEEEENEPMEASMDSFPSRWDREIRIPVNQAIIDAVKAGAEVEVTLRGKVSEIESHDHEDGKHNRKMITVDLTDVEIYEESAEDAMERGHAKANRGNRYRY